ncbi:protein tonB [Lysobacter sp. LF1]|uniref:Protein tonB n=1 Tax=Lysobacter stagni TaxID=3045172 RepID=A0ABT6XDW7_9GAMM|nr:protein tonB [Lysobacter sp. LF1]MDI9238328.1 protein tonB [Lysobacter sp. LF1]
MWKRCGVLLVLMLCAPVIIAGSSREEVRKQVEASMLVKGTIDIDPQGQVVEYHLEQAASLTPALLGIVDRRIRAWQFEPVLLDGRAVRARSPMQLRLVTKKDGENYLFRIAGATFGSVDKEGESPTYDGKLRPPRYPEGAVFNRVGGTVYLVLRIGRDGSVEAAVAEQVNLRSIGTEREMKLFREMLADSAIYTSRRWKFNFPTRGEDADAPFVSVRVPVDFIAPNMTDTKPGEWQAYVPGPRQDVPWRDWDAAMESPDAIASGGVYPDRPSGPRLIGGVDG